MKSPALYGLFAVVVLSLFFLRSREQFVIATASNQTPWYMSSSFMVPVLIVLTLVVIILEIRGFPIHCIAMPMFPGCM
jgi:hypothetical protein